MVVEIGHFALILAFCVALVQASLPLAGALRGVRAWMDSAPVLALAQLLFVGIAFACLAHAFLHDDFSVRLVAEHSNTLLPRWYKLSALWGNHEGSMLLWVFILSVWSAAVALFSASLPRDMRARVLSVMGMVAVGFYLFVLLTSNPFARAFPEVPAEGRDLNPLLQDIGLVLHPPMLYLGYVGFSVAFAFAIAALSTGRLDSAWARWSRPWTNAAWVFLTLGITLGSWWAYYELGWGGWWFWDPVENASFMPWLVGTALIHSLAVTEKRGLFRSWTVLLAITAFSLSLLGTFLVRSGVLTSVHAFATDPERGLFVLAFLGVVIGGSLTLYALRAPAVSAPGVFGLWSRETALLGNNVLLVIAMATVLVGTLYPLLISALDLGRLSVGPPYFNMTFVPPMAVLALIMGVGPLARWRHSDAGWLRRRLLAPAAASIVAAVAFPFLYGGSWHAGVAFTVALAAWILATLASGLSARLAERGGLGAVGRLGASYWGMWLAHLGMAMCIAGAGLTTVYSDERDVRMAPGDEVQLGEYRFTFLGTRHVEGANFSAEEGTFVVHRGEERVEMSAQKRNYRSQMGNVMTEAAIDPGFLRDLYVSLGEPVGEGAWAVRVHHKPFVRWLWLGGVLMGCGGVLTLVDRRYRAARVHAQSPAATASAAAGG
jgi:cytochrome c-type biogenesis protein CcmF